MKHIDCANIFKTALGCSIAFLLAETLESPSVLQEIVNERKSSDIDYASDNLYTIR